MMEMYKYFRECLHTSEERVIQAAHDGDIQTVEQIILEETVDVNARSEHGAVTGSRNRHLSGYSALDMATRGGHCELMSLLIDAKADVNSPDNFYGRKRTPLHKAASSADRNIAVIRLLAGRKANINQRDSEGDTALHLACSRRYLEIANLLIHLKADTNIRNKDGRLPIYIALRNKQYCAVDFLRPRSATPPVKSTLEEKDEEALVFPTTSSKPHNAQPIMKIPESPDTPITRKKISHVLPAAPSVFEKATEGRIKKMKLVVFDELCSEHKEQSCGVENIQMNELSDVQCNPEGHFDVSFLARLKDIQVVIMVSNATTSTEIQVLSTLPHHPNVLSIIGICADFRYESVPDPSAISIVTTFQARGSLIDFLKNSGPPNALQLRNIALGMSRGLQHLHKNNILHRHIAARNFFVSAEGRILISVLGLSRHIQTETKAQQKHSGDANGSAGDKSGVSRSNGSDVTNCSSPLTGPDVLWRWCAPETIGKGQSSKQSDMWMLGVALWEIQNKNLGELPFCCIDSPRKLFGKVTDHQFRLQLSEDCPRLLADIIGNCCKVDNNHRIDIDQVVEILLSYRTPT